MNYIDKLRIGPKLLLAPCLVLVLLIVLASGAYYGMLRQNLLLENTVRVQAARLKSATDISSEARLAHANTYKLLSWINADYAQNRIDTLIKELKEQLAAIRKQMDKLSGEAAAGEERRIVEESAASFGAYGKAIHDVIDLAQVDQAVATNAMTRADKQFAELDKKLDELNALENALTEQGYASAKAEFQVLSIIMAAVVAISVLLSLLVTVLVRKSMLREIHAISAAIRKLESGDLTFRVQTPGNDEIAEAGRALDRTVARLHDTLDAVRESIHTVDVASREIASGNADLSSRTEQQAGSLEETAASMEELTSTVRHNADNAKQANQLAISASDVATEGGRTVSQVVSTMESINESARKIVNIISVIDGIAFQTNILALNAAVEAARAGEQGRGFAVVAGEVRNLAQRSSEAAKEIKTLIGDSVDKVHAGSKLVQQAGATMDEVVSRVKRVTDIVGEIAAASQEQSVGIEQVNQAIAQMDQVTQQNAALVEEAAAATESLQGQAAELSKSVSVFQLVTRERTASTAKAAIPRHLTDPTPTAIGFEPA